MSIDVILLEDDPSKKNRLLQLLNGKPELFGRIDTALCTNDALRLMKAHQYDLLIADVVVPNSLGGEKSEQHCIAMFERLDDGLDNVIRPKYALPVSASTELTEEAHEFFRGRPWGILPYDESNDTSLVSIEKVAAFVVSEKLHAPQAPSCDIFLIAALMDPEFLALEELSIEWGALEPLDRLQLVRYATVMVDNTPLRIASGFCHRMGPVPAAVLTTKAMLKLRPKLVIMAGICAGIPGKAEIGDVLAAEISWDWQSGKHVDSMGAEAFQIAPHQVVIDDNSRTQLLLLKRDKDFWDTLAPLAASAKTAIPRLILGPVATGSSVLADARVSERIRTNQHKNVVGLDMETYGVYSAVESCDPSTKVISMKAVCDKGDLKKDDQFQSYAAKVSAAAVLQLIKRSGKELLGL